MLMITFRNSAPTTAPMNEPRPPSRLAPPSTAAAMLVSVKLKPALGSPTWTWAARNKPPRAAAKAVMKKARMNR